MRALAALVVVAALTGCSRSLVVLLPEDDGRTGALEISGGGAGVTILDRAYAGARSGLLGDVDAVDVPRDEVRTVFAGALSAMPPAPARYVLYFEEGTTEVTPGSRPALERMLDEVRTRTVADLEVTGHTDRVGTVEDNDRLARERATMVRAVLVRQGLPPDAVRAVGRGEREPLVPTADAVREPRNRRVTITVR